MSVSEGWSVLDDTSFTSSSDDADEQGEHSDAASVINIDIPDDDNDDTEDEGEGDTGSLDGTSLMDSASSSGEEEEGEDVGYAIEEVEGVEEGGGGCEVHDEKQEQQQQEQQQQHQREEKRQQRDRTVYDDQENLEKSDLIMPRLNDSDATCRFLSDSTNIVAATASEIEGMNDMDDCPELVEPVESVEPALRTIEEKEGFLQAIEEKEGVLREAMAEKLSSSLKDIGGAENPENPPLEDLKQTEAEETVPQKDDGFPRPLRVLYIAPEHIRQRLETDLYLAQDAYPYTYARQRALGEDFDPSNITSYKGCEFHECVGIKGKFNWFRPSEITVEFKDGPSEKFEYRSFWETEITPLDEAWVKPDLAVLYVPEDEKFEQRRLRLNISLVMDYFKVLVLEITEGPVHVNKPHRIFRQRICEKQPYEETRACIASILRLGVGRRYRNESGYRLGDNIGLFCGHLQQSYAGYCDEDTLRMSQTILGVTFLIGFITFLATALVYAIYFDDSPRLRLLRDWQVNESQYPVMPLQPQHKALVSQDIAMRACVADEAPLDMRTITNIRNQMESQEKKELSSEGYFEARVASPCHAVIKIPVLSVPFFPRGFSTVRFKTKALVDGNKINYDMAVLLGGTYALLRFPPDQLNDGIVWLNFEHEWAKEEKIQLDFNQETSLKLRAQAAQFQQTLRQLEDRVAGLNAKMWESAKDIAHDFRHVAQEETSFWSNASSLVFDRAIEEAGLLRKKFNRLNFTRKHMGRAARKLQARRAELLAELRKQRAASREGKRGLRTGAKHAVQEVWLRINPFQFQDLL
ncbi:hypothetical protein KEM56_001254 [Ascosphaera pollenicola]|nr:hypothetical protein KEM56_001254 [Ascosphaera pollenicola]